MQHFEQSPHELDSRRELVLLTGASGYVGRRLLARLEERGCRVRCLVRDPQKLSNRVGADTEVVAGDVLDGASLDRALAGIQTAYYLVHLMESSSDFERLDRTAAKNFAAAAEQQCVRRIVYLGGLGDDEDPQLSPHLRSRHEVGRILRDSGMETIEFRAAVILGRGSRSFELLRSLTNRLPVMICPRWLDTPTQPISIDDILTYLIRAFDLPAEESRVFEIGGPDVCTYGGLIREYARQQGLRRYLIPVPVLTPWLSSLWLGLVTPATAAVGRHLIEGLRNPTVVRDNAARDLFPFVPMGIEESIRSALKSSDQFNPSGSST